MRDQRVRHRRFVGTLVAVVVAAFAIGGCGDDDEIGFDEFEVVTDDDAPVVAERAASFFIELDANPTTGYQWQVSQEPDPVVARVVSIDYVPDETDEDVVGSGGIVRIEVEAVGVGTTTLGLEYVGPGADAEVAETRRFTVEVVEP
jgi:inhibitor of cysteine peptidase